MAILISDKNNKIATKDNKEKFIMIKESFHSEDITIRKIRHLKIEPQST